MVMMLELPLSLNGNPNPGHDGSGYILDRTDFSTVMLDRSRHR